MPICATVRQARKIDAIQLNEDLELVIGERGPGQWQSHIELSYYNPPSVSPDGKIYLASIQEIQVEGKRPFSVLEAASPQDFGWLVYVDTEWCHAHGNHGYIRVMAGNPTRVIYGKTVVPTEKGASIYEEGLYLMTPGDGLRVIYEGTHKPQVMVFADADQLVVHELLTAEE